MANMRSEFTHEDGQFYYGNIKPGDTAEGIECPYCGLCFVIMATDDIKHHEFKPIPVTGAVDSFCPCCGKNLKEYVQRSRKTSDAHN